MELEPRVRLRGGLTGLIGLVGLLLLALGMWSGWAAGVWPPAVRP